jgi:hypothetical protein
MPNICCEARNIATAAERILILNFMTDSFIVFNTSCRQIPECVQDTDGFLEGLRKIGKAKGKVHRRTGHADPEGE